MNNDVFSPAFGNRPSQLVGRNEIIEAIVKGLESNPGSKERAVVITGQRGLGKTVLLWEIADRARKMRFAVANPTAVREGSTMRIVEKLQMDAGKHLRKSRRRLTGGNVGALGFSAGVTFAQASDSVITPEGQLDNLVQELNISNIGALLLVDELRGNSSEVRRLVDTYQELVDEGANIAIVLAGLPGSVSATLNDHVLTFLNRAFKITLSPLRIGDVDAYFKEAFETCRINIDGKTRRQAAEATQGSPYLMQLIGHFIVAYAKDNAMDESSLDDVLRSAEESFENDVCQTMLAALSRKDVEYLRAMAHIAVDSPCSTAEIAQMLGISAGYGQQYRKRLIDAGVIRPSHHGYVTFDVPYLGNYLLKSTS